MGRSACIPQCHVLNVVASVTALGGPVCRRWRTKAGTRSLGYQEFSWPCALSPSTAEGESLSNSHFNFPASRMVRNVFFSSFSFFLVNYPVLCTLLDCHKRTKTLVVFLKVISTLSSAGSNHVRQSPWGERAGHYHCLGAWEWGKTWQQDHTHLKTGTEKREMRRGHRLTLPSKVHPGDRWPAVAMKELTLEGSEWIGREWREGKSPQSLVRKIFCRNWRFYSTEGSSSVWWFSGWIQTGFLAGIAYQKEL